MGVDLLFGRRPLLGLTGRPKAAVWGVGEVKVGVAVHSAK